MKKVLTYTVIVLVAFLAALNQQIFIFPNRFAPSGLNGLCTMVQHLFGISMGYLSLLINIPLAAAVFFKVSRPLAVRSMVYVTAFSVSLIVLDYVDLSAVAYATDNGTSTILGPLVAGVLTGFFYSVLIRGGTLTGGTDFIASLIHKVKPHFSMYWIIFMLNCFVAFVSYFVYDYKLEPVILCVLYSFLSRMVSESVSRTNRSAVRFEIITEDPTAISQAIIHQLHHSATLLPGKGIYRGRKTSVLVCVVNRSQVAQLSAIIRNSPNTFAVMSSVGEVMGNFKHLDPHGNQEVELLDDGNVPIS